jgi:hypothetical protein
MAVILDGKNLKLEDIVRVARRREINVTGQSSADVPVAFSGLRLGDGGPVLAVGKDLRSVAAIQQRFLDAQQDLERGYWGKNQADAEDQDDATAEGRFQRVVPYVQDTKNALILRFEPPRPLEEIDADLAKVTERIQRMLTELSA